jgi:ubiquinone/menaquinone biosynthesis C-methylase UbiE
MQTSSLKRVREFYDTQGWTSGTSGETVNHELFGLKEDGPIRAALRKAQSARIEAALAAAGPPLSLLECGCGGNPATWLLKLCKHYTGADFSETGLALAKERLAGAGVPADFHRVDVCDLPFAADAFDAVFSAHTIYHIADPALQARALSEMVRVTRGGGVIVLVAANPYPLLWPARLAIRTLAQWDVVRRIGSRLKASPLPYNPQSLSWMRRILSDRCDVEVFTGGLPTTAFNQNVSEHRYPGKALWRVIQDLELSAPRLSARLGNYVVYICRKR